MTAPARERRSREHQTPPTKRKPNDTEEREATLLRLRAALADVDDRMVKLFRGTPHHVARAIDALSEDFPLLPAKTGR